VKYRIKVGKKSFREDLIDIALEGFFGGTGAVLAALSVGRQSILLQAFLFVFVPYFLVRFPIRRLRRQRPEAIVDLSDDLHQTLSSESGTGSPFARMKELRKTVKIPATEAQFLVDSLAGQKLPTHVSVEQI